jgi:murein tripeptide amidase MpaA
MELVSDTVHANLLREMFYFKIIPMINMDGVAKGNYRFSAAGVDLNRKWKQPIEQYHPEVFYLK